MFLIKSRLDTLQRIRGWRVVPGLQRSFRLERSKHAELMAASIGEKTRQTFWKQAALDLEWGKPFETVLDTSNEPFSRWFPDGELNVCWNAVDRWVEQGRGEEIALYFDSPATGTKRRLSFRELQDQVSRFAGALAERGVGKGDKVVIYMPMIPEAAVAMLGCARIGAVHSVVFGGFASKELATRIDDAKPKAIISASCAVEPTRVIPFEPLLQGAIDHASHKPDFVLFKHRSEVRAPENQRSKNFDDWDRAMQSASPHGSVMVKSTHPLYILYTSGTTAQPKGVLRDSGGYATALKWSMQNFMDLRSGETYWAASDIGWVVGHSYIVYGPLLHGCSTVMYEGKPTLPDAGVYWRVVEEYGVNAMFTAPTAARAIRKVDPTLSLLEKYNVDSLKVLFLAGERADPSTVDLFSSKLGKPVVDNYWQTELGWPGLGFQSTEEGTQPGSAGLPVPGYDIQVLCEETSNQKGKEAFGDICIKLPLPPGCFLSLNNADERCKEVYYSKHPGYYMTGDAGFQDALGYFHVMSRTDDVINVAAHRLSSGELEEVLCGHPDVAESAVIGAHDDLKGQVPVGFIVLRDGSSKTPAEVEMEVVQRVREEVGPVASFKTAFTVSMLPKTRSGKILRGVMSKMADGLPFAVPGTVEDMAAVDHVEQVISKRWRK